MAKYEMPVPTRGEWQQLRDGAHVKKGAAKVSIGDSIEKVHKSFAPDKVATNIADTQKLVNNLDSYMNDTKAKYPAFQDKVKTVRKHAANHLAFMQDMQKAKNLYPTRYATALQEYNTLKAHGGKPSKLGSALESFRGCLDSLAMIDPHLATKQQMVRQYHTLCASAEALTDHDKTGLDKMFEEIKA